MVIIEDHVMNFFDTYHINIYRWLFLSRALVDERFKFGRTL